MSRILRTAILAITFTSLLTGVAQASVPTKAEGVSCTSTKACTTNSGGALMLTPNAACTVGLPVRSRAGLWYVVTVGHCVFEGGKATWRQSGVALGQGIRWEYGGKGTEGARSTGDVGIIRLARKSSSKVIVISRGRVGTQPITSARDAKLGEKVCVTAGRTGTTSCGTVVTATTSLRYASPGLGARTITNLALVKGICVNPGDSGSPVFTGKAAVGIVVAKSASGCYLWYTKLPAQLKHFGLTVSG